MRNDSVTKTWKKLSLRDRTSTIYIAAAALVLFLLLVHIPLSQTAQGVFLVILVSVIGLPHGALDYAIARKIGLTRTSRTTVFFFSGYLFLAVIAIFAWLVAPSFALVSFLLISVYHFSFDWSAYLSRLASLLMGCIIVTAPAIFHTETVATLFHLLLLPQHHANFIARSMLFSGILAVLTLIILVIRGGSASPYFYVEALFFCVTAYFLPPLLFFLVYFCFLHAMRHMYDCAEQLQLSPLACYLQSVPVLLLTLAIAYLCFLFFRSGDTIADILRWVFIGLFGLTIPHMCLLSYWYSTKYYSR